MYNIGVLSKHKRVGLDTNVFIYFFEENDDLLLSASVSSLFEYIDNNKKDIVCSTVLLTELLCRPFKDDNRLLINQYQKILFTESSIAFITLTPPIALRAAEVSGKHSMSLADSLHIASVIEGGATVFVTADRKIKSIEEIEVLYL